MRQWLLATTLAFTTVLAVALHPAPAQASSPPISGSIQGLEWCPKSICGTANFSGYFRGSVDGRWAIGVWTIYISYDQLPALGEPAVPIAGTWRLATTRGTFSGTLVGTLANNGDNTFPVAATLTLLSGGSGTIQANALLDHRVFPPRISGTLTGP